MLDSFKNPPVEYHPAPLPGTESSEEKSEAAAIRCLKIAGSAAHLAGGGRVPSQGLGSDRWSLSIEHLKSMADWQACLGVNLLNPRGNYYPALLARSTNAPHPVIPNVCEESAFAASEKADFELARNDVNSAGYCNVAGTGAPELRSYQAAWRPFYRLFADYAARLCYLMAQGTHRAQIALLQPSGDFRCDCFDALCEHLVNEHLDYDILTEESIKRACAVDQGLAIAGEHYELLIIPPAAAVGHETKLKIEEMVEDGGQVMEAEALFSHVLNPNEMGPLLRGNVSKAIKPEVSITRNRAECRDIACVHRRLEDGEVFFFANRADEAREVRISVRSAGAPHMLNLETGDCAALPNCTQRGGRTLLLQRFERHGSLAMLFTDEPALAVSRTIVDEGREIALADNWDFSTEQPCCLPLDAAGRDVRLVPAGTILSGSWTGQGYPFYSGTGVYRQVVEVPRVLPSQRIILRADDPADMVEFVVNGVPAGARAWPPFEADVTALVRPGPNTIEIKVTNSLANALEGEVRESGLIGGAKLVVF